MTEKNQYNDIIFYTSPEGNVNIEVIYNNETFWLSQKRMAELFGCSTDNISLHIKNIFKDKELDPNSVAEEISATAADGKNYKTRSAEVAKKLAEKEYDKFRVVQRYCRCN